MRLLFTGLIMILFLTPAFAQPLWQIGVADNSYSEFAIAGHYDQFPGRFAQGLQYNPATSQAINDWPFILPGPGDAWAGGKQHALKIQFDLPEALTGACRFYIDLYDTHKLGPGEISVKINERTAYNFQLNAGAGDQNLTAPIDGKETVIPVTFPGSFLNAGENTITITSLQGSWSLFDALWLETGLPLPDGPEIETVMAESTPYFRTVNGQLKQAVRINLNNPGIEGTVSVALHGKPEISQIFNIKPAVNDLFLLVEPFTEISTERMTLKSGSRSREIALTCRPYRQWTVYLAPSAHTDIGYTDLQQRVYDLHNRNTTQALEIMRSDPDFVWNLEVAFQAELFRRVYPQQFDELGLRIREGRMGVQGLYLNMLTGLCSGEEMLRVLEASQRLAQEQATPILTASLNDVPSAIGTMPMLLKHAGLKYFTDAVNSYRGPTFAGLDPALPQSPFWWEAPDGSQVLAMLTTGYAQGQSMGITGSSEVFTQNLLNFVKGFERDSYNPDAVLIYGICSDNQALLPGYVKMVQQWNNTWDYPKIKLARVQDFFSYIEQKFAPTIPVVRGDFGTWWEDGAGSSANETALTREARAQLETVQRRQALEMVAGSRKAQDNLQPIWENVMFYNEHTWGAAGSITDPLGEQTVKQWEVKAGFATDALKQVNDLINQSALFIDTVDNSPVVKVVNELSWPRDITVYVPLKAAVQNCRVREIISGMETLSQSLAAKGLVFIAKQVPAHGASRYVLEPVAAAPVRNILTVTTDPWAWETERWQMRIDSNTGAIASLVDRHTGREWVEPTMYRGLNQLVYVKGGGNSRLIHGGMGEVELRLSTTEQAEITMVENSPVRGMLRIERTGNECNVITQLVFESDGRILICNKLTKQPVTEKEAVYFTFPFAVSSERIQGFVDLPYGVIEVEKEQAPGGCRDWYAVNTFAAISDVSATACLATPSAPLVTFNDINRGQWRKKLTLNNGTIFAYVMNNYWDTNYKASQGGNSQYTFMLDLKEENFNPLQATRFGWEATRKAWNMAEEKIGTEPAQPDDSLNTGNQLLISSDAIIAGGLCWQEDALRITLYNPTHETVATNVNLPTGIQQAFQSNLLGFDKAALPVTAEGIHVTVPARGLATVLLTPVR